MLKPHFWSAALLWRHWLASIVRSRFGLVYPLGLLGFGVRKINRLANLLEFRGEGLEVLHVAVAGERRSGRQLGAQALEASRAVEQLRGNRSGRKVGRWSGNRSARKV